MKPSDVPAGPLVIDTDVYSWLATERDRHEEFRALVEGHLWALSFATVGELLGGASKRGEKRYRELFDELNRNIVLPATDEVVLLYGRIHGRFTNRLHNRGHNDMWTAACALAQPTPAPVVTGNLADFKAIATEFALTVIHPDLEGLVPSVGAADADV